LGVVVAFLLTLVSFGKYDLASLSALAIYPVSLVCFERTPLFSAFRRYWFLLLPVFFLGAANPFFDRTPATSIGGIAVSGGWLSFAVLALKGILSFAVGWSFLRKIGVEGLAEAFAALRLPPSSGLSVLLMHRYLVLMIKEVNRMRDAYALRSGTLGMAIRPSSWGSFVGLLLMRSMDRAAFVQAALELRGGENGVLRLAGSGVRNGKSVAIGAAYFIGWATFFVTARFFEPMRHLGDLIQGL
jgi:cobalt/nickel transport system permease protein